MRYVSHDRYRVGSGRVSGLLVEECIVTSTDRRVSISYQLSAIRHRVSQRRNCVPVPGRYLIHGHCGQHLQPDFRARRLYPLDSFAEQLVGLSTTQPVDEKRR